MIEPKSFDEAAMIIAMHAALDLAEKNADYGPNNILGFGEKGILIREWDKINRLKNLLWDNPGEPKNESLDDTWRDILGYALIAIMLRKGWFTLPLAGTCPETGADNPPDGRIVPPACQTPQNRTLEANEDDRPD